MDNENSSYRRIDICCKSRILTSKRYKIIRISIDEYEEENKTNENDNEIMPNGRKNDKSL